MMSNENSSDLSSGVGAPCPNLMCDEFFVCTSFYYFKVVYPSFKHPSNFLVYQKMRHLIGAGPSVVSSVATRMKR